MELLALAEEAVVGAVLEGRAIGGEVDAGGGEPSSEVTGYCRLCLKLKGGCHQVTDPHSFVSICMLSCSFKYFYVWCETVF